MKRRDFARISAFSAAAGSAALWHPGKAHAAPNPPFTKRPKNPRAPRALRPDQRRSVLVAGGGLAGLSAALELAERGYEVTVRERSSVLGGRLATRDLDTAVGPFRVEHGLHMWFGNYHVFRNIRERLNLNHHFRPYDQVHFTFRTYRDEVIESAPKLYPLNLVNMLKSSPNLSLFDGLANFRLVTDVMHYNHDWNFRTRDDQTFVDWASQVGISRSFYDLFLQPAASVTLNDPNQVSAAEMIMYTHLFMVSNPRAFDREITTVDHATAVIDPWAAYLSSRGVRFELGRAVDGLRFEQGRAIGEAGGERFDAVVLATNVTGTKHILSRSIALDPASEALLQTLQGKVAAMDIAPPYKVLRAYFDRQLNPERPDILETPQHVPINLVAQFHQLEDESRTWAERTGGSVLEFHLYADPMWGSVADAQVWPTIAPVALELFPELAGARLLDAVVGSYHDFTSFAVGQATERPAADYPRRVGASNLTFAGDWVSTDYPSALMERAVATGREAANDILLADGVRQAPLTVTTKHGPGLL